MATRAAAFVDMICRDRCVAQGGRPVKVRATSKGEPSGKDEDLTCPHCGGPLVLRP